MANQGEKTRTIDGLQSVVGIVGITLGVIPLVRMMVTGESGGLLRWLIGSLAESLGYFAPLAIVVVAVGIIAALEISKKRV